MVDIRYLTNGDLLQYKRLASICYTYPDAEQPRACTEEELHQRVGVFGEDGTLLSAMIHNRYTARFEGHDALLVGVGGVVTDPVARGRRGIRGLFETYLPMLYNEGYVFSALYPFSHVFYRKFGYEFAFERRTVELSVESLRDDLCRADEIIRVLPDEDDRGMREIYDRYIEDKHFAIRRDDAMWRELRQGTPWEKLKYAYVLRRGGRSVAYWIGTVEKRASDVVLTLADMAYTSRDGCEAIFAMLRGMNEIDTVRMTVPAELNPHWLVREPNDVGKYALQRGGMMRVMNVEKALAMLVAPPVAGHLTVDVTDPQIPQNSGCFTVTGDGVSLTVSRSNGPADMRCSINGLSVLIAGLQDFDDGLLAGHATLMEERVRPFASMLFPRRKTALNWHF